MIDPHVHCRDWLESYKATILSVMEMAEEQGIEMVFDMPNTNPPILSRRDVRVRLNFVPQKYRGKYFLYVCATSNKNQLNEAVECCRDFREVVGLKLYAGESVGELAVVDINKQRQVYKELSALGYQGVLAVHCEKADYCKPWIWNPNYPITHYYARPKECEIEAIKDQIKFAKETSFPGILYIVHISCPESVALVEQARKEIKIVCGVTPHHILWNCRRLEAPGGLLFKTNPPLRRRKDVEGLRELLKAGAIDWIESDHAPHALSEKMSPPHLSGYPSIYLYRDFVNNFLPKIGVSKELKEAMTKKNILKVFGDRLSKNCHSVPRIAVRGRL